MNNLTLYIPGQPIAKARPRFVRRGKFVQTFNPQETLEGRWLYQVYLQLPEGFKPFEFPVYISLEFVMPIPKSVSKARRALMEKALIHHTKKPDCDNCVKFVLDCCNGVLWRDDSQVVRLSAVKRYGSEPHTKIILMNAEVHA